MAGWYPDPLGPPNQLRWWDGTVWSSNTQTPAAPSPAPPSRTRGRPRRVIAWGAIGGFALATTGVVIAVSRGQDVCAVSATGVEFCERAEVEQEQPALDSQASALEQQAREDASGVTQIGTVDLNGVWTGDNGFSYVIEQFGDQAVVSEVDPSGLTTAVGFGFVDGDVVTFRYEAWDGSAGSATLQLDGDTLSGTFQNFTLGTSTQAALRR